MGKKYFDCNCATPLLWFSHSASIPTSTALLPDRDTILFGRRFLSSNLFLNFSFMEFCARTTKFVQVVSCCQVIYIIVPINSLFNLKFYCLVFQVILFLLLTFHTEAYFISLIQRKSSAYLDQVTFCDPDWIIVPYCILRGFFLFEKSCYPNSHFANKIRLFFKPPWLWTSIATQEIAVRSPFTKDSLGMQVNEPWPGSTHVMSLTYIF